MSGSELANRRAQRRIAGAFAATGERHSISPKAQVIIAQAFEERVEFETLASESQVSNFNASLSQQPQDVPTASTSTLSISTTATATRRGDCANKRSQEIGGRSSWPPLRLADAEPARGGTGKRFVPECKQERRQLDHYLGARRPLEVAARRPLMQRHASIGQNCRTRIGLIWSRLFLSLLAIALIHHNLEPIRRQDYASQCDKQQSLAPSPVFGAEALLLKPRGAGRGNNGHNGNHSSAGSGARLAAPGGKSGTPAASRSSQAQSPSQTQPLSSQTQIQGQKKASIVDLTAGAASKPSMAKSVGSLALSNSWPIRANLARNNQVGGNGDFPDSTTLSGLQISVTPRVSSIRAPAESNAILKCLISSQTNKFTKKFSIHWSRYMYDENVYEQIESFQQQQNSMGDNGDRSRYEKNTNNSQTNDSIDWQTRRSQASTADALASNAPDDSSNLDQMMAKPFNRQQQLRDFLARTHQETNVISDLLIEATLSISPVKASDNASYYCTVTDGLDDRNKARIDLVALSQPIVLLERVRPARDSKSALVYWLIVSDGNTPIKKTILMVRNNTVGSVHQQESADSEQPQPQQQQQLSSVVIDSDRNQWQRIDIAEDGERPLEPGDGSSPIMSGPYGEAQVYGDHVVGADVDVTSSAIAGSQQATNASGSADDQFQHYSSGSSKRLRPNRRQRSFNLSSLLPGVTYNLRLAAINDMGQSNWTYLSTTMPNEIPAQISEMFLLSRSNDSLAIGWRRPTWDGAKTIRYELQLFDLNRTLTLDANTNTNNSATTLKTNFMYIFVNLNPGTDYHFHVRACSRAGCSAFSSPKLLATTLDGEPDEPMDVQLDCQQSSDGNLSVTWSPPHSVRGLLLNYSVIIDSKAKYRNQSGQMVLDEWRTTLETSDNYTTQIESGGLLIPNTNYSVQVCANNRSKHCGKLSPLTSRATCQTAPDLPGELPEMNFKLINANLKQERLSGLKQADTLAFELPFISRRNGSIDCIQLILIRLPNSFNPESSSLKEYLPKEPKDLKLSQHSADNSAQTDNGGRNIESADAYLAEEIDQTSSLSDEQVAESMQLIQLGDGSQAICQALESQLEVQSNQKAPTPKFIGGIGRVFDRMLKPSTYYTGFLKVILIKDNFLRSSKNIIRQERSISEQTGQLVKYSGYFKPIRTSESVLEFPFPDSTPVHIATNPFSLNSQISVQEMANRLGSSLRLWISTFYNSTSSFVNQNKRLNSLGNFIIHSSPAMQLFEVGMIVLILSLLLLSVIYILTLPASLRRKRKRKLRKQLERHQDAVLANNEAPQLNVPFSQPEESFVVQTSCEQSQLQQQLEQQPQMQMQQEATIQEFGCSQVIAESSPAQVQSYAATLGRTRECPIHSSPQARHVISGSEAVHVCPPMEANDRQQQQPSQQSAYRVQQAYNTIHHAHHHHHHDQQQRRQHQHLQAHHHHNQQQQQLHHHQINHVARDLALQDQYERNCRTARRQRGVASSKLQVEQTLAEGSQSKNLTLSHQNSILAFAKRINKSIPLSLFGAVFECRVQHGWLREEYEQLPRQQFTPELIKHNSAGRLARVPAYCSMLKLRPQLIVSRNDTVSALISGNDRFDASFIRLNSPTATSIIGSTEKKIICAKSPLDADSVWDFWRLIYELEVSTIVMLTQIEDQNTGESRCAQYWPTCDNEETTILSPCNEYVQKSSILPAKFKIRQETLEDESRADDFKVRRLTLMVMATKVDENEQNDEQAADEAANNGANSNNNNNLDAEDDENNLLIVERTILHLQFYHWNASNLANQMRLIKFIEMANERHSRGQQQESPSSLNSSSAATNPMLVHCFNGLGRSGLFTAMSFIIDELSAKLANFGTEDHRQQQLQQQQLQKLNIFQLVSRLRSQRDMLVSPYRLYELVYQLTLNCIPIQETPQLAVEQQQTSSH